MHSFIRARDVTQEMACRNNMEQIEAAKDQAAGKLGLDNGATLQESQIAEFLEGGVSRLVCPKKGEYTINAVGTAPACSVHGPLADGGRGEGQAPPGL